MATRVWLSTALDTDANFRLMGSGIKAAFAAIGLVQLTSGECSGQIDWTTVTRPTNAFAGFEMWRFNDSLQATAPVLIKFQYGTYSTNLRFRMSMQIGSTQDGAGNFTSAVTTVVDWFVGGNSVTGALMRLSGASNRFVFVPNADYGTTHAALFSVERTHDASGADTNEGVWIQWRTMASNTWAQQYYTFSGGQVSAETTAGALLPSVGSGTIGSVVSIYPVFFTKGVYTNPSFNVAFVLSGGCTPGVPFQFSLLGATRTWVPINPSVMPGLPRGYSNISGTIVILIRWD